MACSRLRLRLLWLTLFAFGVQIAVADFHHHASRGTSMEARALTAGICSPSPKQPCKPLQNEHGGCVLCWAAAIATTSVTPPLFSLPGPSSSTAVKLGVADAPRVLGARLEDARARGPPAADLG
ncbi:MAG: hypothetical protein ABWX70_03510 [Hyphomicrobium sp.]